MRTHAPTLTNLRVPDAGQFSCGVPPGVIGPRGGGTVGPRRCDRVHNRFPPRGNAARPHSQAQAAGLGRGRGQVHSALLQPWGASATMPRRRPPLRRPPILRSVRPRLDRRVARLVKFGICSTGGGVHHGVHMILGHRRHRPPFRSRHRELPQSTTSLLGTAEGKKRVPPWRH